MSEKILKFNNIRLNKKEFHKSKKPTDLMSVNVAQIVVSELKSCIILPQMSVYMKYFENGGKNMLFD